MTTHVEPNQHTEPAEIADVDRDSLHILPLGIIPFETNAIRRARLIRNAHLDAVVELFDDRDAGSGQIAVEDVAKELAWPSMPAHPDLVILRTLAHLPSYDVYSLRILLRKNGIPVHSADSLQLSPTKVKELTSYMTAFIEPLMLEIYGDEDVSIQSFDDVVGLFRNPNVAQARRKLMAMAEKLGIGVMDIPKFIEDYGDIFLSFSYYRNCLDQIVPAMGSFLGSLDEIREHYQLKNDHGLMKTCKHMESTVNGMMVAITGRFENFEQSTNNLWQNLSAQRFHKVQKLISDLHTTIGGVLCALSVKIDAWVRLFPNPTVGGPMKRAEFIMTDMRHGLDKIQVIEDSVPTLAAVA